MLSKGLKLITIAMLLSVLIVQPAHAYIDPGTGSTIIQGIIAIFLAVPFVVKKYWGKIASFLKKNS